MKDISNTKILNSKQYKKANNKAGDYLNDPQKLTSLIEKAKEKFKNKTPDDLWEELKTIFRMLKLYSKGDYKNFSKKSIFAFVACIIYLVMPLDLIPDFIIGVGLIDDLALLGYTINTFSDDINKFKEWEKERAEPKNEIVQETKTSAEESPA